MSESRLFNQPRVVRNPSDAHTSSQDSLTAKLYYKEWEEGKKFVLECVSVSETPEQYHAFSQGFACSQLENFASLHLPCPPLLALMRPL